MVTILSFIKSFVMRKTASIPVFVLLVSLSTFAVIACSKKKEEKNCQTCKVFKSNGEVLDQATVCSEEEKTAFQIKHPDNPAHCE
jgi:hypothetical protein